MSEERLAEIRERCEAALKSAPCVYYLEEWPGILRNDIPFLFAEVERLEQRNHLEAAVVAAALAVRRADLSRHPGSDYVPHYAANVAWYKASDAYHAAIDALLAFRDEEAGDE